MLKAKVIYNEKEDAFEIWINTGDGWGFSKSYKCQPRANQKDGEENTLIHFSLITTLREMQEYGYKIFYL